MASYVSESIHDLLADESLGSSDAGSSEASHNPSRECFMADAAAGPSNVPQHNEPPRNEPPADAPKQKAPGDGEFSDVTPSEGDDDQPRLRRDLTDQDLLQKQKELEDARVRYERERAQVEHELEHRAGGSNARNRAREVHRRIVEDEHGPPPNKPQVLSPGAAPRPPETNPR